MEQLLQDIASTYWWIILLVGLVVGVLGTFLADGIKKTYGLVSSRQREKNLQKELEIKEDTEDLVNHPEEINDYLINSISLQLSATRNFLLAFVISLLGFAVLENIYMLMIIFLMALLPYIMSVRYLNRSVQLKRIARDARTRLRKENKKEIPESEPPE